MALLSPTDTEGLHAAAVEARDIASEMDGTVSALLRVWRGEQDAEQALGTTSFGEVLRASLAHCSAAAAARDLKLEGDDGTAPSVGIPERPLALVVGNLLSNAVAHARTGSTIAWTTRTGTDHVAFALSNDHENDLEGLEITDPFVSTGRREDHAGLGLSLSRALCDASGMELRFEVTETRFEACLTVPLCTTS